MSGGCGALCSLHAACLLCRAGFAFQCGALLHHTDSHGAFAAAVDDLRISFSLCNIFRWFRAAACGPKTVYELVLAWFWICDGPCCSWTSLCSAAFSVPTCLPADTVVPPELYSFLLLFSSLSLVCDHKVQLSVWTNLKTEIIFRNCVRKDKGIKIIVSFQAANEA